jgi:peptidoglycan/LPS O-acetylase OafA/YrhL
MKLTYRADIDGIRAIAVLAVVFYHAGFGYFSGGFVGVDIFFVISGFLITSIIYAEISTGIFSFSGFYTRRIRRIYPALFAMIVFTTAASVLLYDHDNLRDFGKSVVATTFFVSNLHFWTETDYFARTTLLKPLLHTWSLAIEEQYYIVFPLLLTWLARRFKSKVAYILAGVTVLSLGWNILELRNGQASSAFYFAHLRIWELLVGSVLALGPIKTNIEDKIRLLCSWLGLGMILTPIFLYTENTIFPGGAAAIPVTGTALLIYAGIGGTPIVNRVLSLPWLVFIGKISYSLYLWHWPLIIFARYVAIRPLAPLQITLLLLATLLISVLSWHFIEMPFRGKRIVWNRGIFLPAAGIMTIVATMGAVLYLTNGLARSAVVEPKGYVVPEFSCEYQKNDYTNASLPKGCPLGARREADSFLLWGDSYAWSVSEGISLSAAKQSIKGQMVYSSGCAPLLGIDRTGLHCVSNNNAVIDYIELHPELKTVILVGRWALWAEGNFYSFTEQKEDIILKDAWAESGVTDDRPLFELGLERTIQRLQELDRTVVLIGEIPEIGYDVPSANFIAHRTGREINSIIAPSLEDFLERNAHVIPTLEILAQSNHLVLIDPWRALCNDVQCPAVAEGKPLYVDDHHLSFFGSRYISHIFDELFEDLARDRK